MLLTRSKALAVIKLQIIIITRNTQHVAFTVIIIIIILMTRDVGVAYKSMKYELCNLKAECTNLAKEFTTAVFLDVNR